MTNETLELNQRVMVHGGAPDHGKFTGIITDLGPITAVIQPEDPALRLWFPNGYSVGSAHWRTTIQPYPIGTES
jgi:hypothetical protein